MKTRIEKNTLLFKYLSILSKGYNTGDFTPLFKYLSEDCIWKSHWDSNYIEGVEKVKNYFQTKGENLKKNGSFPICSIQELIGNVNMTQTIDFKLGDRVQKGLFGIFYTNGEPCLLMKQMVNKKNESILCLKLDSNDKIFSIKICKTEFFQYREFLSHVDLIPVKNGKPLSKGLVYISENYYAGLFLFLGAAGVMFNMEEVFQIPISDWIKCLENWKCFNTAEVFTKSFERIFGVADDDYIEDMAWADERGNSYIIDALFEWTEKYKNICDSIKIVGFTS